MIPELILATHNDGKAREIADLLHGHVETVITAGSLGLPEPVEDGDTFKANALIKARAACAASGKPALADDSGLSVNALNGDPGIYSARWGGEAKDFNVAMARVHEELGDAQDRSAAFICALALVYPNGKEIVVQGECAGDIIWPPRGNKGFGYDPIFTATGMNQTFAEIDPTQKHALSHRANAFEKLLEALS